MITAAFVRSRSLSLKRALQVSLSATVLAVVTQPAEATTFDFNSLADGASNTSVQTYMRTVLGCASCVTVTNSLAEANYTGDGHVVGPTSGTTVTALTLGRSDGTTQHLSSLDTFLVNASGTTEIIMTFTAPIYNVSFDYEIFPDGTCPNGASGYCGSTNASNPKGVNWPDFKFYADGSLIFKTLSVMPGNTGAPYTHSPNSGSSNTEMAPQFLGVSGTYFFENGVTQLRFVDWPAMIGIDNLRINELPPPPRTGEAPEPASMLLLGAGLVEFARRRRQQTKA